MPRVSRCLSPDPFSRGSKYPNSRVLGPRIHALNGFWGLETLLFGHLDPQGFRWASKGIQASEDIRPDTGRSSFWGSLPR